MTLQLSAGEELLWSVVNQRGFFKKKVVSRILITSQRIIVNDSEMPLEEITDVVILNRHNSSHAQFTNYRVRTGRNPNISGGGGNINSKSKNIGDIIIISPTRNDFILRNVSDCVGLRSLIQALIKNRINQLGR